MGETAFSSSAPDVISAWEAFVVHKAEVWAKRKAAQEKYGRPLMVRRDWDHGTRACGFAMGEEPYDEKAFKVVNHSTLEPRMSTKAGKAVAAELAELTQEGVKFPGMPQWFISGGMRILSPAIFEHGGTLWLFWPEEPEGVEATLWQTEKLSAYYVAKEAHDATEEAAS